MHSGPEFDKLFTSVFNTKSNSQSENVEDDDKECEISPLGRHRKEIVLGLSTRNSIEADENTQFSIMNKVTNNTFKQKCMTKGLFKSFNHSTLENNNFECIPELSHKKFSEYKEANIYERSIAQIKKRTKNNNTISEELKKKEMIEATFIPKINEKSRKLMNGSPELADRLKGYVESSRTKKTDQMAMQNYEEECTFRPHINYSQEIELKQRTNFLKGYIKMK